MGYGEYGGNGSVIWKVEHEENDGGRGKKHKDIKLDWVLPGEHPRNDKVRVNGTVEGRDKIQLSDGAEFTVTLRYPSEEAARTARDSGTIAAGDGGWFLKILVPIITNRENFGLDLPLEVKVEWPIA